MQRMPKPMVQAAVCGTCAHYHQHYVLGGKKFVPLWYGHCVASKLKDRILTRPASAGRKTTARNETSHSNNDRGTVFSVGPFPTGEPSSRSGRGKPLPYITYGNVRVHRGGACPARRFSSALRRAGFGYGFRAGRR